MARASKIQSKLRWSLNKHFEYDLWCNMPSHITYRRWLSPVFEPKMKLFYPDSIQIRNMLPSIDQWGSSNRSPPKLSNRIDSVNRKATWLVKEIDLYEWRTLAAKKQKPVRKYFHFQSKPRPISDLVPMASSNALSGSRALCVGHNDWLVCQWLLWWLTV